MTFLEILEMERLRIALSIDVMQYGFHCPPSRDLLHRLQLINDLIEIYKKEEKEEEE